MCRCVGPPGAGGRPYRSCAAPLGLLAALLGYKTAAHLPPATWGAGRYPRGSEVIMDSHGYLMLP